MAHPRLGFTFASLMPLGPGLAVDTARQAADLGLQLADGAVHRHAAHAELRHQLGLGRHQLAWRPAPGGQAVFQVLLDLLEGRQAGGRRRGMGQNAIRGDIRGNHGAMLLVCAGLDK